MTIVLTQLKKLFCCSQVKELKIVIVGLDNAGKTTLLYKFADESVSTIPTIGYNVEEIRWRNFKFLIWDIGGQEMLRQSWNSYYTNANAIILVVDSTDENRLPTLKSELESILRNEELDKAAILVFANKQDLPEAMSISNLSHKLGLTSSPLLMKHKWRLQPGSALDGKGLKQGLDWITQSC